MRKLTPIEYFLHSIFLSSFFILIFLGLYFFTFLSNTIWLSIVLIFRYSEYINMRYWKRKVNRIQKKKDKIQKKFIEKYERG